MKILFGLLGVFFSVILNYQILCAQQWQRILPEAKALMLTYPDSAIQKINLILPQIDSSKNPQGFAEVQYIYGSVLYYQGVYQEAFDHLLQAREISERIQAHELNAQSLLKLGQVYHYNQQINEAKKRTQEALSLAEQHQLKTILAEAKNQLGFIEEKSANYPKAILLQKEALQLFIDLKDKNGEGIVLESLGSIYEDLAIYDSAMLYYVQANKVFESTNNRVSIINTLNNIGDIYRKSGNYKDGIKFTQRSLEEARFYNFPKLVSSGYRDLAKCYSEIGKYELAYLYLDSHRNIYTETYKDENQVRLGFLQTIYQSKKKDQEIKTLQDQKRVNQLLLISAIIALLSLAIATGLVINRQKSKAKNAILLRETERQLNLEREKITQIALEKSRIEEERLKTELDYKASHEQLLNSQLELRAKELTSFTLELVRKNNLLNELRAQLQEIYKTGTKEHKLAAKEMLKKIDISLIQEKEWSTFTKVFEEVHHGFFQKLQAQHPEISSSELRLAALIKINMPTKDMGTVLGISTDSLRISRYRLKKKLGLENEDKLSVYIRNFA